MYRSNQNQDVVRLLLRLKSLENEYPLRMFSTRRTSFISMITRYVFSLMRIY
jgi:hypothetical protein